MLYIVEQTPEIIISIAPLAILGIGAAIAGIATGVGTIVGSNRAAKSQAATNRANAAMAHSQNRWNLEQWQRENEYNSPEQQMQRLKQAGLNPNLAYANGTVQNVSAHSPQAQRAELQAYTNYANDYGNAGNQIFSGIGQLMQSQMMEAQTDLLSSQSEYQQSKIETERLNQIYQNIKNSDIKFDFDLKSELRNVNKLYRENELTNLLLNQEGAKTENQIKLANLDAIRLNMSLTHKQIAKVAEEIKYIQANRGKVSQEALRERLNNGLRMQGINPEDPVVYRLIGRALDNPEYATSLVQSLGSFISASAKGVSKGIGSGLKEWFNGVLDWFK